MGVLSACSGLSGSLLFLCFQIPRYQSHFFAAILCCVFRWYHFQIKLDLLDKTSNQSD